MALANILRARADALRRTARVECGELGSVTVEALPLRELELLLRQPDPMRAVFYAACRELQLAGEELRRAAQVYAPDEIMQMVSSEEATLAAQTILELSGWHQPEATDPQTDLTRDAVTDLTPGSDNRTVRSKSLEAQDRRSNSAAEGFDPERATAEPDRTQAGVLNENGEIRLLSVQEMREGFQEIRPESVQSLEASGESRLQPVQEISKESFSAGQDSHETGPSGVRAVPHLPEKNGSENDPSQEEWFVSEPDKKAQGLVAFPKSEVQNVGSAQNVAPEKEPREQDAAADLHENESEVFEGLHEIKSDFSGEKTENPHESRSEFWEQLHESTSEFPSAAEKILHEMESDFGVSAHETESELPEGLHETESELAERMARRLLEGLRRAAAVR